MRGLGGRITTVFQSETQVEATYGKLETIRQNQGLHLRFAPEKDEDAEALSKALGEYSWVVKERNISGDRVGIPGHLAEQNRIETRRWYTPFEVKGLTDRVILFTQGLQGVEKQYCYDQNPTLEARSEMPPPKESDVQQRVPFCITNMEAELGAERFKLVMSPAPDKIAANREAAEQHENGCRIFKWENVDEDTGRKTFFAQVWLPDRPRPVLNDRKGYPTDAKREAAIAAIFVEFGLVEPEGAPVVEADDECEAVAIVGMFDHLVGSA
jgi:hypothetical protein